jgi:hypothetical protein
MPGPFILIATHRLKPGALDAERRRVPGLSEFIESHEPRVIAFNEYADPDRNEVSVVQIHPDPESMEFHAQLVAERAAHAYGETLEATTRIQLYGSPSAQMIQTLRVQAGSGVEVTVSPEHLGGFTRSVTSP